MTNVHGYVLTIILIHVSFVIGALSFALRDVGQNGLAGLRTPATLRNPETWKQANRQVAQLMPLVSAACIAVAALGFWIDALRTGIAFLIITAFQIAVLLAFTIKWWSPPDPPMSLLREQEGNDSGTPESRNHPA